MIALLARHQAVVLCTYMQYDWWWWYVQIFLCGVKSISFLFLFTHVIWLLTRPTFLRASKLKQAILEKFSEKWLSTACSLCAQLGEPHPGDICTISSHLTLGNGKQDYFNVVLSSMSMTFLLFVSVYCFCTSCIGSWEQGHIRYIS